MHTFYKKVRADALLGPVFNSMIAEQQWPAHLAKLSDFWETNLFAVRRYKGSPMQAHQRVDAAHHYQLDQAHFGRWLHLWFTTIDALFSGPRAQRAKDSARRMATGQYTAMWAARPGNQQQH